MLWEKLLMTLGLMPFIIAFFFLVYLLLESVIYNAQLRSFYSSLCSSCGFVNVSYEMSARKELTDKIFDIWNKCLWDTDGYKISNIIMKKEKDNTIYLTEIYHHSKKGTSSTGQTVLFIELPLHIKNTCLVREKKHNQIKATSNRPMIPPPDFLKRMSQKGAEEKQKREENPVKNLSMNFSEKFEAYTLEGPDETDFLNDELQQFIANYKGKYPFINSVQNYPVPFIGAPLPGGGQIVISSNSISIYSRNTSQEEHLRELLNLSNGLVELVSKIKI